MTGEDVRALQQYLNANGFTITVSGAGSAGQETTYFGQGTKAALAKYQAANGISPAAGYFGPLTRQKIGGGAVAPVQTTPAATVQPVTTQTIAATAATRSLELGMTGTDVSDLQKFLLTVPGIYPGGTVTGTFDAKTRQAVGNFQFKYGILFSSSDPGYGIVGPKTRVKMQSL